jgi:hypothetical protein
MSKRNRKFDGLLRLLRESAKEIVVGLIVTVVGALLVLHFVTKSSGGDSGTGPTPSGTVFTVEDVVNGGVWALGSPTGHVLAPMTGRPNNAVRWLREHARIDVLCARRGTSYPVVFQHHHEHWQWWAFTSEHTWIPMAAFHQTVSDGAQGLPAC